LPQLGWKFYDPFFTALVFCYAPRSEGRANPTLAVQGVVGILQPVSEHVSFTAAVDVPWTFYPRPMLGLTAVAGVSFRF
jgi:hypothetical protein